MGYAASSGGTSSNSYRTAVGYRSADSCDGNDVTALGYEAGRCSAGVMDSTGSVVIGRGAGRYQLGTYNTYMGSYVHGGNNGRGSHNVAVGYGSYYSTGTGSYNVALGSGALWGNNAGNESVAIGYNAMYYANSTGTSTTTYNTAVGHQALRGSTTASANTGKSNTAVGHSALLAITSGNNNIAIGDRAADALTTGTNNITIGSDIDAVSAQLNIGNAIYGDLSNKFIGIGNNAPSVALDVTGDIEYTGQITDVSDQRLKNNIVSLSNRGSMLEKLSSLGVYSFTMKADASKTMEFGVIAQELKPIFPELVKTANDKAGTMSVNYIGLIAPLIQAMKELQTQIEEERSENVQQQSQIDALKAEIEKLHSSL